MLSGPRKIKSWRKDREPRLTLEEAGKLVDIVHSYWYQLENGAKTPSLDLALKIEVLTKGSVQIEDWGFSSEVAKSMRTVLARRDLGVEND